MVFIKKLMAVCLLLFAAAVLCAQTSEPAEYETGVGFHDFPWGTSLALFTQKMGSPLSREEINGFTSVVYKDIEVSGFNTYMAAFFSKSGLQGGAYYFDTPTIDELMRCYNEMRQELRGRYGPTALYDGIIRERRPYECSWQLPGGYVYLKVNLRVDNAPVTLWYSSPALTKNLLGDTAENENHSVK